MILLIGGEKGGPGKTTLATNLAAMRTRAILDVLLIDTDRQLTASYWCSVREDNNVNPRISNVQKFDKTIRAEVLALSDKYKDIIIDAGGRDSVELRGALSIADKAVFPFRPSQFDLWTLGRLNTLVETAKEFNPKLQAYIIINQALPNPAVREVDEAKELIGEFPSLHLYPICICERISFRRAAIKGLGVTEYTPADTKANEEMMKLYQSIYHD